jgi:replicative DNA helicase
MANKEPTKAEKITQMEKQAIADALTGNYDKYIDGGITPKHFSKFRQEWEWIVKTERQYGKPPTSDSFGCQFPAMELPEKTDATGLIIDQIDKEYKFNIVALGVNDLIKAMRDGRTSEGLDQFVTLVNQTNGEKESGVINLYETVTNRLKKYEDAVKNPQKAASYGFKEIDQITGGLWSSDLIILAGRAGTGKTLLAIESARCVAKQGYKVGYFNGEMDEYELGYRLDTLETHISNFAISNGKTGRDGAIFETYRQAASKIASEKAELLILNRGTSDAKITPAYLEKFCKRHKIDVLYIESV